MFKKLAEYYLLLTLVLAVFSCTQQQTPVIGSTVAVSKPSSIMSPFHYHKMIEVAPGQNFDIMSWGTPHNGSLLILHSDSANNKFTTTTGDLEGAITDVFNSDMDTDGNPELLVEVKAKDTVDYTAIYAYEFKNNEKANKLNFPKLTKNQITGYRGKDNFYMKDGKLIREFPVYDGNTVAAKPTGQKRVLQYNLHSNNLTVTDLSASTLKLNTSVAKKDTVNKPQGTKKPDEKKTKTTRIQKKKPIHKKETYKRKKKKHRHHRNE